MNNTPFGLQLAQDLGANYKGGHLVRCYIPATDSTAVGQGCAVKLAGSADADGNPTVARVTAGDAIFGVVVGFEEDAGYLENTHRTASTARYAFVYTDPDALYVIQEDAVGGALAAVDVGLNADLVVGSVNTTTGVSGMMLDSSSKNTTGQLKIMGLAQGYDEGNAFGATYAKFLVKINEHQMANASTGV